MLHFEILIQRTNQESIWSLGYWKHFDKQRFWKLNCIIQYKRCALNALLSSYSPNPPLNPIQQNHALSCSQAISITIFVFIVLLYLENPEMVRAQPICLLPCARVYLHGPCCQSSVRVHLTSIGCPGRSQALLTTASCQSWPGAAADVTAGARSCRGSAPTFKTAWFSGSGDRGQLRLRHTLGLNQAISDHRGGVRIVGVKENLRRSLSNNDELLRVDEYFWPLVMTGPSTNINTGNWMGLMRSGMRVTINLQWTE